MTAICPACGRRVSVGVPAGGDGSANVYYRHNDRDGRRCRASRGIVAPTDQVGGGQ